MVQQHFPGGSKGSLLQQLGECAQATKPGHSSSEIRSSGGSFAASPITRLSTFCYYDGCRLLVCDTYVRTDVSKKRAAYVIRVTRIGDIANVVPSSPIFVTLIMEATNSSETSILTKAAHHISEDGILHSHSRVNLKTYIALAGWAL
jgi:hypothetical protein